MQVGKPILVQRPSGSFNRHNSDWLDLISTASGLVFDFDGYETWPKSGIFPCNKGLLLTGDYLLPGLYWRAIARKPILELAISVAITGLARFALAKPLGYPIMALSV